jgi:hypothetical protein
MLQHTGRFWWGFNSNEKCHITGISSLLSWLQLIFTCSLDRNKTLKEWRFCDANDMIKNAIEE